MVELTNAAAEICVIGRLNFHTGIGAHTYAMCELFSRYFPVCIYPVNSGPINSDHIHLPNGRKIPVCKDLSTQKVFIFVDVIWNNDFDLNYTLVPPHGLRIAYVPFDSDELPAKWIDIFNNHFDVVYFTSRHLEEIAAKGGVKIATGTLPLALDIEPLLSKPYRGSGKTLRFGCVAAFHPRKGLETLVRAYLQEFSADDNVELVLHSNLAMGETYDQIMFDIKESGRSDVIISHANLSDEEKINLIESIDVFVSCSRGEGYSIGPREALALGKSLVLSDLGPHRDLFGVQGVYKIPTSITMPARYPEINNQVFGRQHAVSVDDTRAKIREAFTNFHKDSHNFAVVERRKRAAEFSFHKLAVNYAEALVPAISRFKVHAPSSQYAHITDKGREVAKLRLGALGEKLQAKNRRVLPAYDAGFFSVFNTFISHLSWDIQDERVHMVLPDWDVGRMLAKMDKNPVSFCYGRPEDGNVWLKLFKPLYGLSAEQMNSEAFLYEKSTLPETIFNERREPKLTYINAYDLYKSDYFPVFRKQYNRVFKEHVHLLPKFDKELNNFVKKNLAGKFVVAAHVKHPSHIIEQPQACIAHGEHFVKIIQDRIKAEGLSQSDKNWAVFLATDQDRVVNQFKSAFGNRVFFYEDVRRTRIEEDEYYDKLSDKEKAAEGFQVQHLVAADRDKWDTRMAWEVIRDAMTMAHCNALYHVVSNVSTAVSYMNPNIELNFMDS